ncbi:uncharacterized protein LOC132188709 [Corylus avellana]|uniref:uncharacterized protein LOC132188709 n=1 Tax=Corylus avellana TaxID=13451 RepID=UPI00286A4CCC|nr:uncharacterized protein LOC132188709 [Corylus avellana]
MAAAKISLKILIEKKSQRVIFAEADKKFVDFLFSILTLPVGTVTRLLQKHDMAGSLHSLYKSFENLSDDLYLQPEQDKDFLLNPMVAIYGAKVPLLLPSVEQHSYSAKKFYRCSASHWYFCQNVANDRRAFCPSCNKLITNELRYIDYVDPVPKDTKASSSSEGGYVKGVITYMVMDDLDVKPMSIISAIILFTKFNVTDVGALEEKVVELGMDEGVKLLRASLQSSTVLTDVFLQNDQKIQNHNVKEEFGIEGVE